MPTKSGENLLLEKESYSNKGESLIEMLVAVTIFAITIGAISGIFISAVRTQRRVLATQELLDQTSYVMEYMGRALRMAKKDLTGTCLSSPGYNYEAAFGVIKFIDYNDICTTYILQDGRINKITPNNPECPVTLPPAPPSCPLTSDKLTVNSFQINLSGAAQPPADYLQPRVTIFLDVESKRSVPGSPPKIQIQTSISQRNVDVQY